MDPYNSTLPVATAVSVCRQTTFSIRLKKWRFQSSEILTVLASSKQIRDDLI